MISDVSIENKPYNNLEGRLWTQEKPVAGIVITHSWRNSMDELICSEAAKYFLIKDTQFFSLTYQGTQRMIVCETYLTIVQQQQLLML